MAEVMSSSPIIAAFAAPGEWFDVMRDHKVYRVADWHVVSVRVFANADDLDRWLGGDWYARGESEPRPFRVWATVPVTRESMQRGSSRAIIARTLAKNINARIAEMPEYAESMPVGAVDLWGIEV